MTTHVRLFWIGLLSLGLWGACAAPKAETGTAETTETAAVDPALVAWDAQIEAFHTLMSGTFHPAEEGNYAPLKEKAAAMAASAATWSAMQVPATHAGKGLEDKLTLLAEESAALSDEVAAGATDEELKDDIFALHDRFHEIVGLCEDLGDGHDH